ncbi:MAG: c-type cytochrome [Pseudomonadota bacterium]
MTRALVALIGALYLLPGLAADGDAAAGESKAAGCAACHGADGNSPAGEFPNLAGQVRGYIASQLAAFKSGERANAIMGGLAAALSEQDMADLDAFYSSQSPKVASITPEQEAAALAGQRIYRGGYAEFNIPACMGCHGPAGHGISPAFPHLAGQHSQYITSQLKAYRGGERLNAMMQKIAYTLTDEQIEQLATYLSGLN